jgi:hypothetical protein
LNWNRSLDAWRMRADSCKKPRRRPNDGWRNRQRNRADLLRAALVLSDPLSIYHRRTMWTNQLISRTGRVNQYEKYARPVVQEFSEIVEIQYWELGSERTHDNSSG